MNRLLIVDDNSDLAGMLCLFLRIKGYDVRAVSDGFSAMRLLRDSRFDLVLLDNDMPGLTGLQLLELITDYGFLADPPRVVMHSGDASIEARSLELGAAAFLMKGQDVAVLPEVIESVLRRDAEQKAQWSASTRVA